MIYCQSRHPASVGSGHFMADISCPGPYPRTFISGMCMYPASLYPFHCRYYEHSRFLSFLFLPVCLLLAGDKVEVTLVWVGWYLCSAWRSFIKRKMDGLLLATHDEHKGFILSSGFFLCSHPLTVKQHGFPPLSLPLLTKSIHFFPPSDHPLLSCAGLINSEDKLQPCIY